MFFLPGPTLLDVISSTMNISMSVLSRAEALHGACTDIARAAEEISQHVANIQGQKVRTSVALL